MARAPNPYRADAGQYSGIGEGISNLANVFLNSQPDPVKTAQASAYAWRGRESRENVLDSRDARQGRLQLGDQLASFDPTADNRALFQQGVGTGAMGVDDLGNLMRAMQANFGGTDEQVGRAVVGAGGTLGENDFVSLPDREMGRSRNAANDIALDRASMSLNERLGDAFAGGGMDTLREISQIQNPQRWAYAAEKEADMANGGGKGGVDWLAATRRGTVEEDADEAINLMAEDMGLAPADVPPQLRQTLLDGAVELSGQNLSPRAAVARLWQEFNVTPGKTGGIGGFFQDDVLNFDIPQRPAAQPRGNVGVTPVTPPSQGPLPGDVEDGYEFQGGNPADPNSWRPVQ